MRWSRNRRAVPDDQPSPIPARVSQVEAARRAIAALVADPPPAVEAEIESVEMVELRAGQFPVAAVVGISLEWRQGEREFGLLMPIERLARQAGDLEGVAFYLRLAVTEPHAAAVDGGRAWFTDLPSGPY